MSFDAMWSELADVGRNPATNGYRRFAWTRVDHDLREWFSAAAASRGLDVTVDRCGNQWAWWGDPDEAPGVVTGSHLDSVPDGGAYDGPLGVVSSFAAVDALRGKGFVPGRPLGVVNFCDEEGARFGIACAGSRLLTGALAAERALALRDADGVTMADALGTAGRSIDIGRDDEALRRIATFVELHVEQGRGLADLDAPVAVGSAIWPHGRYRAELPGEANHAGTTRLDDRVDPTLTYARLILAARESAQRHGAVATCGKVRIEPNGVNAIPSLVTAWIDARAPLDNDVRAVVAELTALADDAGGTVAEESWTDATAFDADLRARLCGALGAPPVLATGAGHDAGILAAYRGPPANEGVANGGPPGNEGVAAGGGGGIATGMIFVRNPTGVSHSPAEFAERDDCLAGVAALTTVLAELTSARVPTLTPPGSLSGPICDDPGVKAGSDDR